jgi:3-mercaptopyruvate sulfurtransferase SseA
MTIRLLGALLLGLALQGVATSTGAAAASLRDDAQLVALLTKSPQCCVIDARSAQHRKEAELPGALAYAEGLRIKPTSVVIVLADDDAKALAVARMLAKTSPHDVYAVKGGFIAWQSVDVRLQAQASKPGSKFTFVVPFNTCEQGKPLHVFEAKPARPAATSPR